MIPAFKLPASALLDKFVAKNKFYERAKISAKLQNEFIRYIKKVTWKYKLSQETIGIAKTDTVTEIQIFEIELKEQVIPKNILRVIDSAIPYQILYVFSYREQFAYGITLKEQNSPGNYYFSDWNTPVSFEFSGISLESVYQKLIRAFMPPDVQDVGDFPSAVLLDGKIKLLEKDIKQLENKIATEKQFNRKVELNTVLLQKRKELAFLHSQNVFPAPAKRYT